MSNKPTIFVSSGQRSEAECRLTDEVVGIIAVRKDLRVFCTRGRQDLESLDRMILDNILDCSGAVVLCPAREALGDGTYRTSVWVEQEIAILRLVACMRGEVLPVCIFCADGLKKEGWRTNLLLNLRPLNPTTVLSDVREWLEATDFGPTDRATFDWQWSRLSEDDRTCVRILDKLGGKALKQAVRAALRSECDLDVHPREQQVLNALHGQLANVGLVVNEGQSDNRQYELVDACRWRVKRALAEAGQTPGC